VNRGAGEITSARARALVSLAVGAVVLAVLAFLSPWQIAVIAGWDASAATFVTWVWLTIVPMDSASTADHATAEDDSRTTADLLLLGACVASLVGVGFVLVKAARSTGSARPFTIAIAVLSVMLAWLVVHTVFTLRYAHLYYAGGGGIDFPGTTSPTYGDFAYVSLTIGMTCQVSDTAVSGHDIRMSIVRHSLLSYVFGFAVIAMTINVVAGLLK
jgi:uncharacterized membrane protein